MNLGRRSPRPRTPLGGAFWRLFASSSASNVSDGVLAAALPLLAAALTRDPVLVSGLAALAFAPWLFFALPAGTLVDRANRRTVMVTANVFRAVLAGGLATAVLTGHVSLPLLYVVAFLLGSAEVVYDTAARAMLPKVVARARLERGNSLLTSAESVGNIFLGAPLGAWLFGLALSAPLWLNSSAWLLAALLALGVRGQFERARGAPTTVRADMAEGLRWLRGHDLLRTLMVTTGFSAVTYSMTSGILVLYALENLGLSEREFGLMLAAAGVGAVVGAMASPGLTRRLGRTNAMGAAQIASSLSLLAMAAWQQPVAGTAAFAVSAATVSMFNVQIMSVRQAIIPERLFGRVQGAYRTVIWGGIPLGTVAGGLLGAWLGIAAVFVISGAIGVLLGVVTWVVLHGHRVQISASFADPSEVGGEPNVERNTSALTP